MPFLRKRRGVSGIISGVFLVALTVMIFSTLSWQFFRADQYNQVMLERQQREWERFNERLMIDNIGLSVTTLQFDVINYGAVTAHITDLYLTNLSATPYQYSRHSLDLWINLGSTKRLNTHVTIEVGNKYQFIVTTERGNSFVPSAQYFVNQPQPYGTQSCPFTFGFGLDDFQYMSTDHGWQRAWVVNQTSSQEKAYRFCINLTNTAGGDIRLLYCSSMTFMRVDETSDVMHAEWRLPILDKNMVITNGTTTPIRFGPSDSFPPTAAYYVFIALFYRYTSGSLINQTFGTTVAVLSVYVQKK